MNNDNISTEALVKSIEAQLDHMHGEINMQRDRPYTGQPWTDAGQRGATEVKGVTFRDIRDCHTRAYILSHAYYKDGTLERLEPNATIIDEAQKGVNAAISGNDLYTLLGDVDPIAVSQNLGCEIEKIMGIFPNTGNLDYKKLFGTLFS